MENFQCDLSPEQFAKKLTNVLDNAGLSMAIGVGSTVGLFSVLADLNQPETVNVIAKKAGLVERYVKEWLGVLVTGQVVTYDRERNAYFLPRNYIPFLTPGKHDLSVFTKTMLMMTENSEKLVDCFRNGGGISYDHFKRFHTWMNELSIKRHETDLISHFIPSVEGLKEKLESGIKCLDIGCGSGFASILLAAEFPNSEFHGFDFSREAIGNAKSEAERRGLKNCHFQVQDCANLAPELNGSFDYVTAFDSIHDQAYPGKALDEIYKVLKGGGTFSLFDVMAHSNVADNIGMPFLPMKYAASLFHCMPVSLYFEGGKGLGACWGKELAMTMLRTAGFIEINEVPLKENSFNIHIICKKPC